MPGLSIVIPAWNEEDRLPRTLETYLPYLASRYSEFEVIVVTDGSSDRTAEVARAFSDRGVRVLEFPERLGKGGAILAGMREARFEYVGYLDADGPIPPAEMYRLVDALKEADCVVASRWVRGSVILRAEPSFNLFAGRVWNFLVRSLLFLPLRDTQCGAKFLRRSILLPTLRAVSLTNRAFDVDLLYHVRKDGYRLRELPVTWTHDPDTRLPIAHAIPVMFVSLLGVRIMNLPLADRVPRRWIQRFLEEWGAT
ncbi:MAG TPA: dolichyl-phosphate beta-glucosyltransferase [Thermoplasmata archaeon]|nr:dolichyl-phosphate beta-glucosyltransferase [Thermoplasmata archaeon]